jgi:hypothetical protein
LPWHFRQPFSSKSFFPSSIVSFVEAGALPRSIAFGTSSAFEKSAEKVVMKYAMSDTSESDSVGHAGIDVYGMPRLMMFTMS